MQQSKGMDGMEEGGGWGVKWINLHTDPLAGVAVATWCSYKVPPCQENVHGAMVPGHAPRTGTLQRCHSFNCDITGSAKFPPEK